MWNGLFNAMSFSGAADRDVNHQLTELAEHRRHICREHKVWGNPGLKISSWSAARDQDSTKDYFKSPQGLLTLGNSDADSSIYALGLFTLGKDRILLRDFNVFNLEKFRTPTLEDLRFMTQGPYIASVKETGSTVLISGFNGKLIVTTRGTSGPSSLLQNPSQRGREWALKHLDRAEKTEKQLATVLEELNLTVVGALCDDEFEETVFPSQKFGIYLTGLNHNEGTFRTESPATVNAFGEKWGFLHKDFIEFKDFGSLQTLLLTCAETSKWQNREIRGFVVRCTRNACDFFFQYKFEQPYNMYRVWHRATRELLARGIDEAIIYARHNRHLKATLKFLDFAADYAQENPQCRAKLLFNDVGHMKLRHAFFSQSSTGEQDALALSSIADRRWILVPVATIGCGKTSLGRALMMLFGSNDCSRPDINSIEVEQDREKMFMRTVTGPLSSNRVTIAERNNARRADRKQFFDDVRHAEDSAGFDIKFVCLNFLPEGVTNRSRKVTRDLIMRSDWEHEDIKFAEDEAAVKKTMADLENQFEPVCSGPPDDQFDLIIDLEPGNFATNVKSVVAALRSKYEDLAVPNFTNAEMNDASKEIDTEELALTDQAFTDPVNFGVAIDAKYYDTLVRLIRSSVPADILMGISLKTSFHVTLADSRSSCATHKKLIIKYKRRLDAARKALLAANTESASMRLSWAHSRYWGILPLGDTKSVRVTQVSWHRGAVALLVNVDGESLHIAAGTAFEYRSLVCLYLFDSAALGAVELPEPLEFEDQAVTACVELADRVADSIKRSFN